MPRPDTRWHGLAFQHTVPADYIYGFVNAPPSGTMKAGKISGTACHHMAPGPPLTNCNTAVSAPTCQYGMQQVFHSAGQLNAHASNSKNSSFINQNSLFDQNNSFCDPNQVLVEGDAPTYFRHTGCESKNKNWGSNAGPCEDPFDLGPTQGLNPGPHDADSMALPMSINDRVRNEKIS